MHVVGQSFQGGINHAVIMIACNEDFVFVWLVTKPFEEVESLHVATTQGEITAVHQHIGLWHDA